jgi:hypothetical protein
MGITFQVKEFARPKIGRVIKCIGEGRGRLGLDPKNKRGEQPNRKRYSIAPIWLKSAAMASQIGARL